MTIKSFNTERAEKRQNGENTEEQTEESRGLSLRPLRSTFLHALCVKLL